MLFSGAFDRQWKMAHVILSSDTYRVLFSGTRGGANREYATQGDIGFDDIVIVTSCDPEGSWYLSRAIEV